MEDELNPEFMFSLTWNELLMRIANGEVDAAFYARQQLIHRGIGKNGNWVGFDNAAKEWQVNDWKSFQLFKSFIDKAWSEKTENGYTDCIRLKNHILIVIDHNSLSLFNAEIPDEYGTRIGNVRLLSLIWNVNDGE